MHPFQIFSHVCSSANLKDAALALGSTIPQLHATDNEAVAVAVGVLIEAVGNTNMSGSSRAACAEGLGIALAGLAEQVSAEVRKPYRGPALLDLSIESKRKEQNYIVKPYLMDLN